MLTCAVSHNNVAFGTVFNKCQQMLSNELYNRELFMVILPVVLWQNSYKRIIPRDNHCQWCFSLRNVKQNTSVLWMKYTICLFDFELVV